MPYASTLNFFVVESVFQAKPYYVNVLYLKTSYLMQNLFFSSYYPSKWESGGKEFDICASCMSGIPAKLILSTLREINARLNGLCISQYLKVA